MDSGALGGNWRHIRGYRGGRCWGIWRRISRTLRGVRAKRKPGWHGQLNFEIARGEVGGEWEGVTTSWNIWDSA